MKGNLRETCTGWLALILVIICSQATKTLKIRVPETFNGIAGKCNDALDKKNKVEKGMPTMGTIGDCAQACGRNDDCASFHFTGQYRGENYGECIFSSFICIDASLISETKDSKTFTVYFSKEEEAWKKSADGRLLIESQRTRFANQLVYYWPGKCDLDIERQTPTTSGTEKDCYLRCTTDPHCSSFHLVYSSDNDNDNICRISPNACAFNSNFAPRPPNNATWPEIQFVLPGRLRSAKMTKGKEEVDVGHSGSGRATAAILAVALAWGILTLA